MIRPFTPDGDALRRTLKILNMVDLEKFGVGPEGICGQFMEDEIPLRLVAIDPMLHIVSLSIIDDGEFFQNKYVPGAESYFVARGVSDPSIEIYFKPMTDEDCNRAICGFLTEFLSTPEGAATTAPFNNLCDMDRSDLASGNPSEKTKERKRIIN